jgi:hypothetical protein
VGLATREVFGEAHRGGHILWPANATIEPDWLLDVYRAVDRAVDKVVAALPPHETIVGIFALHRMGPNHSQNHFTSQILERINRNGSSGSP